MKDVICFVLLATWLRISGALICRRCNMATYLEQCTSNITCGPDEPLPRVTRSDITDIDEMSRFYRVVTTQSFVEKGLSVCKCFTETILDSDLKVFHSAGCSATSVCSYLDNNNKMAAVGRRELVACYKCCNDSNDCNNNLCGLKSNPNITTVKPVISTPSPGSCYYCNDDSVGTVTDPRQCRNIATCDPDEMCTAEDFVAGGTKTYGFGCMNKDVCKLLTKFAIEDRFRCQDPALQAAGFCNRKRSTDVSTCKVCCTGALCNLDTCEKLLDHMYMLWQNGVFDLSTLKQNGTLPSTTTSDPHG